MVPLFAKMMDTLPECMGRNKYLGVSVEGLNIPCLAYVDDVTTLAVGYQQQELTLRATDKFAIIRQLEWSAGKCKVMEVGTHREKKSEWKLGDRTIEKCKSYKYLGETISRDGRNMDNLAERFKKVKGTVRAIMTCGRDGVMKKIETRVLLKLHECVTVAAFLTNAETWTLDSEGKREVNKIEIWALKKMFGLPPTTPTPAVIYATGTLFASIRIEKKQLLYLQKLLQKEEGHWATGTLKILRDNNIGWARRIGETLASWGLEENWEQIMRKSKVEWKREVEIAAEKMNRKRLKEECYKKERGEMRQKTKTRTIIEEIDATDYERKPIDISNYGSVLTTRALIMGRYGMLNCGANFAKGYGGEEL